MPAVTRMRAIFLRLQPLNWEFPEGVGCCKRRPHCLDVFFYNMSWDAMAHSGGQTIEFGAKPLVCNSSREGTFQTFSNEVCIV